MLNEAGALPHMMGPWLEAQQAGHEVVLVDGGSADESVAMARSAGLRVISSAPGRALQMNAGAASTSGKVLLFLHADTVLPEGGLNEILQGLSRSGSRWGRFDVEIEGRPRMLRVIAFMMNVRSRWSRIATGDQAIFVERSLFEEVGAFPVQPLMEDIELSRRLKRIGALPLCLKARVRTSGRRWELRGVWPTIFLMWRLRFSYWAGVPADKLARAYR